LRALTGPEGILPAWPFSTLRWPPNALSCCTNWRPRQLPSLTSSIRPTR
jgi:hypothetical protein